MDIKKNDKRMAIVICSIYTYVQSILYNRFKEIDWPIYCYFVHFPNLVEYNLEHSLSESQDCTWPVLFCYGVPCLIVSIYSSLHCIWSLQGVLTMGLGELRTSRFWPFRRAMAGPYWITVPQKQYIVVV